MDTRKSNSENKEAGKKTATPKNTNQKSKKGSERAAIKKSPAK